MKAKEQFILQEIADEVILVPVGKEADRLHGVVKLNPTGAFLWKLLSQNNQSEESLSKSLMNEFSVSELMAINDTSRFLQQLRSFGCIEE